ncbi:glycosyltransferase family 2 protein [Bifidobacterium platyrrhinorum]|uniref:Glycosyltransferase n=1 Tax=Bifidobacterium platyrrhinorum TaxID=2661628 RepID=A0A6L9SQQ0_9BIFI|nr:glycosyltransferase family 2 protein [Bifidobacterium platyrrhinorum]NEG54850.1 glycosyltransferase [Bifidobacterium platyrrhinorum]
MGPTPKVTVALAVYNQQACIQNSIQKIAQQTIENMEILCVDDGSTDDSLDIMEDLARKDHRIRIVAATHAGVSAARNRAIDEAGGEWLIFHDPDDAFANNDSLATLLSAAEAHDDIQAVGGSFAIRDESSGAIKTDFSDDPLLWGYTLPPDTDVVEYSDYQFDYGFHRFMFRTEFLRSHDELRFPAYTRYQDPPFLVAALTTAGRFVAVHDVVYLYSLGHQAINWTDAKKLGVLNGIADELRASGQHRFAKLHDLAVRRLEKEYAGLYWWMLDENPDILAVAAQLNSFIQIDLLSEEMRQLLTGNDAHAPLTFPLRQQIANSAKWHEDVTNLQGAVLAERRDKERAFSQLDDANRRADDANRRLNNIVRSRSFRIGRLLTALPRFLQNHIRQER